MRFIFLLAVFSHFSTGRAQTAGSYLIEEVSEETYLSLLQPNQSRLDTTIIKGIRNEDELIIPSLPQKVFKDYYISFENKGSYQYLGALPDHKIAFVMAQFYEMHQTLLIDLANGNEMKVWDDPVLSPGGHFILLTAREVYDGEPNGVQVIPTKRHPGFGLYELFKIQQRMWYPEETSWADEYTIIIQGRKINDGFDVTDQPIYIKVMLRIP